MATGLIRFARNDARLLAICAATRVAGDGRLRRAGLASAIETRGDMRAVLDHCEGGQEKQLAAEALLIHEGQSTGHLYVLIEGKLDVIKGGVVVATVTEPGAILGEMSVLLNQPHTATVRAATESKVYQFDDASSFLRERPAVALLVAQLLAQRLNAATTYLADIKRQYAGHGNHLSMVGDVLESLVNLSASNAERGSDRLPERLPDPRL